MLRESFQQIKKLEIGKSKKWTNTFILFCVFIVNLRFFYSYHEYLLILVRFYRVILLWSLWCRLIALYCRRTVGVLSAIFGVTNRLLDASNAAVAGDASKVSSIRTALLDAHAKVAQGRFLLLLTRTCFILCGHWRSLLCVRRNTDSTMRSFKHFVFSAILY